MAFMDAQGTHFSPARGWAVAGAGSFPALMLALGPEPGSQLVVIGVGIAGIAVVTGAMLAARAGGFPVRESARAWAVAFTVGVLVYVTPIEASWPQPDNAVIVRPDGRGGMSDEQGLFLFFLSIGVTLLLGAALDESHRAAAGQRLRSAASAAAAWAIAMLPLPVLILFGFYATSFLGNTIPFWEEVPAHLFGLICSGALAGFVVGAIAEGVMRRVRA